jgi:hypothetical protein
MKTKLTKILGVSLAVILVFGLAFAFMPTREAEAQAWTANQWNPVTLPSAINNIRLAVDSNFIAIGSDGATFYAASNQGAGAFYKSTNGGLTWVPVTTGATAPYLALAVSPDDVDVLAFVDSSVAEGRVYISTNGGATWSTLPRLNAVTGFIGGTGVVTGLDVSAATLTGREYMVCLADLGDGIANGNVFIFGTPAFPLNWVEYGADPSTGGTDPTTNAAGAIMPQDFTSCAFSPNYSNDSVILVVGSDNAAPFTADTYLNIKNTGFAGWNSAAAQGFVLWPVAFDTATADSPGEAVIVSSGIAFPSDFDPTNPNWRRVYGFYNAPVAANVADAYRFDDYTCRELNVNNGNAIELSSMSYSGTLNDGTLFVGDYRGTYAAGTQVRRCYDPWVTMPTWYVSPKAPTGTSAAGLSNTQVAASPNFSENDTVYAATSGAVANDQSAFSRSTNGGVSFNQISLIDANITSIPDIAVASDGGTLFMATTGADGAAATYDSLWRSVSSPLGFLWERVGTFNFVNTGLIRLDPAYVDTSTLYFAQVAGTNQLKYSTDGGEIWTNRYFPAAVTDFAVEDATTLYALIGTTTRKSTNAGWGGSWGLPKSTGLAACATIIVADNGDVLVGGGANVAYSTDGGDTYTQLPGAIGAGAGNIQVAVDKDYATNGTVYAASSTLTEGIYRWVIGTDTAWEQILAAPAGFAMSGLVVASDGYLYGARHTGGAAPSVVDRIMVPTLQVTDMANVTCALNIGATTSIFNNAPSALKVSAGGGNLLFAVDTTGVDAVMVYDDSMASAVITVDVPAKVTADPATGRNNSFTISWNQVSNATQYFVVIWADQYMTQRVYSASALPAAYVPPVAGAPTCIVPFNSFPSGATYWASVCAVDQAPGDANLSPWSALVEFMVEYSSPIQAPYAGPVLLGPTPGATDVIPDVGFSWGPILGATEYLFTLAKDANLTDVVVSETVSTTAYGPVSLDYATDYWYAVKATAPSESPQSVGSFTTIEQPVEKYTCQYCGLTFDTRAELDAHIKAVHAPTTPLYIWIVIAVGAILVIAVIWLIFSTRRA